MRGSFVFVVTIATIAPSTLSARSDGIPTLDIRPVCRGIASQSADPGIGQGGQAETFQRCVESEQAVREEIKKKWPAFSAADKQHCVTLAKTGGESSNTELLTCLEMARDVRILRSTARAVSGEDLTKPASSLSMPAVQEDLARTASPPVPAAEGQKTELPSKEVEQAKPNAAESEATAQRKLADAEAALKTAKEEAKQARAEAERAKADAQAARSSEVATKRKLADAEAARAETENACRPGLRLRDWLRRPGSKNH